MLQADLLGTLIRNVRYALRMLRRTPVVTGIAILSLALGIGANTAIFSIVDAVLLRMLPVRNPEQLIILTIANSNQSDLSFSYPAFQKFRDQSRSFSKIWAFSNVRRMSLSVDGQPEMVYAQLVSGDFYTGLGVDAALGRTFTREEDKTPGSQPVVVISHSFWERKFGMDQSALGKKIFLNGSPFSVIGIAPQGFYGVSISAATDIWLPTSMQAQVESSGEGAAFNRPDWLWLKIMGRPQVGVSEQQVRADVNFTYQQVLREWADSPFTNALSPIVRQRRLASTVEIMPASQGLADLQQRLSRPLLVLMAVVGAVLLIACVNLANLLLSRTVARQKEVAMRLALGASRATIIWQFLTESIVLSLIGGAFGLIFAWWGRQSILFFLANELPTLVQFRLDARLLGFMTVISILTGILFGILPALRAARFDLNSALKETAQSITSSSLGALAGKALVISQVAFSLVLLISAGLFVRSLANLRDIESDPNHDRILVFSARPTLIGYRSDQLVDLYNRLLKDLESLPGIQSVSLSMSVPLGAGGLWRRSLVIPGYTTQSNEEMFVGVNAVSPRYFETLGIPLLSGRDFRLQDDTKAPKVAVVNESVARQYFGGQNPIGRQFAFGNGQPNVEIVGLVKDTKYASLRERNERVIYIPFLQRERLEGMTFEVRSDSDPKSITNAIRSRVQAINRDLPIFEIKTMRQQIDASLVQERLVATLVGFFSLLALLLTFAGLYGVMSYGVTRRINEIGIRMALGATRRDIIWLVMRKAMALVLIGVAAGLGISLALTRLISSLLFGIASTDPITIALAVVLLLITSAVAGFLPASKAARTDPLIALRYQ